MMVHLIIALLDLGVFLLIHSPVHVKVEEQKKTRKSSAILVQFVDGFPLPSSLSLVLIRDQWDGVLYLKHQIETIEKK